MDYRKTAQDILDHVGGSKNIASAAHCATRLRLVIADNSKVKKEELENVYTGEGALASQRARAIIQALERYTADMRDVKALGFCVSKNMPILWQTTSNGRGSKPWPWMRTARRMSEMKPGRSWKAGTSPSFS